MGRPLTRPRRRLDALRRPQILEIAIELMRERGLWSVRISDVAERAGMSAPNVVYYFGTKDDLFVEAITSLDDAFYQEALEQLAALPRAIDRLVALIVRSSTADWLLWVELWTYSRHHPDTAAAQRRFNRRWRTAVQGLIELGVAKREWRVSSAADAAQRLCALMEGLAVQMVLDEPDGTPERYVELALAAAALELGCELTALQAAADAGAARASESAEPVNTARPKPSSRRARSRAAVARDV